MKTLILVRHAKSSHSFSLPSDFDRPLNERGFREASEMGKKLFKKKILIDLFISSPAVRAKTTAELFVAEYNRKLKEIVLMPSLYHSAPENFLTLIHGLSDEHDHVALFSHNPGITDFASSLTLTQISQMPTCSVLAVTSPIESWRDFTITNNSCLFFYKPE